MELEAVMDFVQSLSSHRDVVPLANPYKGPQVCEGRRRTPKVSRMVHGVKRFFTRLGLRKHPGVGGRTFVCCAKASGAWGRKRCMNGDRGRTAPRSGCVTGAESESEGECTSECTCDESDTESEVGVERVIGCAKQCTPLDRCAQSGWMQECTPGRVTEYVTGESAREEGVEERCVTEECVRTRCASIRGVVYEWEHVSQASTSTGLALRVPTLNQGELLIRLGSWVRQRPAGLGVASLLFGAAHTGRAVLRSARSSPRLAGRGERHGPRGGRWGRKFGVAMRWPRSVRARSAHRAGDRKVLRRDGALNLGPTKPPPSNQLPDRPNPQETKPLGCIARLCEAELCSARRIERLRA